MLQETAPSYWNWTPHKSEMGFSAVSPALCTHLQLPPCWVFHVPLSRETSVASHLKWEVATFGYILNHDRLSFARWLQILPPDVAREKAGGRAAQDLMPPALAPAALVAFWLLLQPQHLGTAAVLAQSVRALQRKLRESSPTLFGNGLCPCRLKYERLCLGLHINYTPGCWAAVPWNKEAFHSTKRQR